MNLVNCQMLLIIVLKVFLKIVNLGFFFQVYVKVDDLGKGGDNESLKTGNVGLRIVCGVIGIIK